MKDEEKKIPPYFYFYTKYCEHFDILSANQAGDVIKYICDYVRGKETELPDDAICKMLIKFMKQDIDNAFRKYHAQCENGKKGGAPKGNRNAAKKKDDCLTLNYEYYKIACKITDVIYFEAKKAGYEIKDYLSIQQIATVAACYYFIDCDKSIDLYTSQQSLQELIEECSASKVCKMLKEYAAETYYKDQQHETPFDKAFADAKKLAARMLEMPFDVLERYGNKCAVAFLGYSDEEIEEYKFTEDEMKEINEARKAMTDLQ